MAVARLSYPEIRRRFLQVLAQTGSDTAACKAIDLHADNMYRFAKKNPDFAEARIRAREEFHRRDDPEIVSLCRQALVFHLQPHDEEWTSITTEVLPDGTKIERRSVKRVKRPPSEWAVRMVIPMLAGRAAGTDISRVELEISGPDGGPIRHDHYSESDIDREISRLLTVMAEREAEVAGAPTAEAGE
jgi:hypothetical protein